ncbi:hypothetical protein AYO47_07610 [Planctomyces sp. SCGC AG-212-M04]|nr:hypothetical protein AYO47_07610 [Planctomyces sp. SCGC AG-212-M04]
MTGAPKPPKRRRRKIILAFVACTLVIVSLATWWYWPRGDARFVGKWDVQIWFSQLKPSTFWFQANGRGKFISQPSVYSGDERSERAFRWWVGSDALYLEWHDDHGLNGLCQRLQSAIAPHIRLTPSLKPQRLQICEVQPDKIDIENTGLGGWGTRTVLYRIHE